MRGPCDLQSPILLSIPLLLLFLLPLHSSCKRSPELPPTAQLSRVTAEDGTERFVLSDRRPLMGTTFQIKVVVDDPTTGADAVRAAYTEIARVEGLISEWRDDSEISLVNNSAGEAPVTVGPELVEIIERAQWVSAITGGAFDVTFASCGHLWNFREPHIPTDGEIQACLPLVDYRQVVVDEADSTLFLPQPGMRLGVGGIGKGYGVDRAARILDEHGISNYIVDGGGDIRIQGDNAGRPWTVGIANPRWRGELLATLSLDQGAVVTSGDYESYFERDGVHYHHILDPSTGHPARGVMAVTVVARNATVADALATGLFVMGMDAGLQIAEGHAGIEVLYVSSDGSVRTSSEFPPYTTTSR